MSTRRQTTGFLYFRGAALLAVWALVQATVWSGPLESIPSPPRPFVATADAPLWTAATENEPSGANLPPSCTKPAPLDWRRPPRGWRRAEPSLERVGFHGFATPAKERDPPILLPAPFIRPFLP